MNKFISTFGVAFSGLRVAFAEQLNLKVHLAITLMVVTAGVYFKITHLEWIAVLLMVGLVLGLELVNTAIENLVDLVTLERNALAGKIKDIAAGAVLLASALAAISGVLLFWPYI